MLRLRHALSILSASLLSACFAFPVHGDGHRDSETRDLSNFDSVENRSSLEVRVEPSDTFSVRVSIDSNVLPLVETHVAGGTLRIDTTRSVDELVGGPHVTVGMPTLQSATMEGSGQLNIGTFDEPDPLSLDLAGSGDLQFDGSAPRISASLDGSGELRLSGTAGELRVDVSGSGLVDARSLTADTATIDLSGSGDVRATVTGTSDVTLTGSGDINLYGGGAIGRLSQHGSGSVRTH